MLNFDVGCTARKFALLEENRFRILEHQNSQPWYLKIKNLCLSFPKHQKGLKYVQECNSIALVGEGF